MVKTKTETTVQRYALSVTTPQGVHNYAGDMWSVLAVLGSLELMRLIIRQAELEPQAPSDVAEKIQRVYGTAFSRFAGSCKAKAATKGVEREVIWLYLMGCDIEYAVDWIWKKKRVDLSKSAIGRCWRNLKLFGIKPMVVWDSSELNWP